MRIYYRTTIIKTAVCWAGLEERPGGGGRVAPTAGASRLRKDQGHKKGSLCRWPGEGSLVRLMQKTVGTERFIGRTGALPQTV